MELLHLLEGIRTPLFDTIFQFFTFFGEETLFLAAALAVFWCLDKNCGYYLIYTAFFGAIVNTGLKCTFCIPRPWERDPSFTIVESARAGATGYSFPSGHTQCAGGLFLSLGRYFSGKVMRIVCIVMTLLVAFSRMYLGVHTPADVLVSLGVAVVIVMASMSAFSRAWAGDRRWFFVLFAPLLLLGASLILWLTLRVRTEGTGDANLVNGLKTGWTMLGGSVGLAATLHLERRYIHFDTRAAWWAQILKLVLGLGIVVGIRILAKQPLLALSGGQPWGDGLRYLLMTLFAGTVWPLTFRRFARLGGGAPEESTVQD